MGRTLLHLGTLIWKWFRNLLQRRYASIQSRAGLCAPAAVALIVKSERQRWKAAFTLVEVLMVVAIVAIVSAVTFPLLARSLRGNRLQTARLTVMMASRYARSMAILQQKTIPVGIASNRIVIGLNTDNVVTRTFDGVTLRVVEGPSVVLYQKNGWCNPHTVEITDDREPARTAIVEVDALAAVKTYGRSRRELWGERGRGR